MTQEDNKGFNTTPLFLLSAHLSFPLDACTFSENVLLTNYRFNRDRGLKLFLLLFLRRCKDFQFRLPVQDVF